MCRPQGDNSDALPGIQAEREGGSLNQAVLQEGLGDLAGLSWLHSPERSPPEPLAMASPPRFEPNMQECQIRRSSHTAHVLCAQSPLRKGEGVVLKEEGIKASRIQNK